MNIKDFEKMFDKAVKVTIDDLEQEWEYAARKHGGKTNGIGSFMFTMQNITAMAMLRSNLFEEEEDEI